MRVRLLQATIFLIGLLLAACSIPTAEPIVEDSPPTSAPTAAPTTQPEATSRPAGAAPETESNTDSATPRPVGQFDVYDISPSERPHDVAPAPDGRIWFTGQQSGEMGLLDPATGEIELFELPGPAAPHGVIVGPDGLAWITDGGANAIVSIEPASGEIVSYPLPADRPNANLNTAAFDGDGMLWFTGQNGIYGQLNPASGEMTVYDAPRGRGPYGITATPDGEIYYASLAGSYIAHVDTASGEATVIEPPTPNQGARRVWSDSAGRIWVSEWNVGQLGLYDPATGAWQEWPLPGPNPRAYGIYVDERDKVWVTDFGGNALVSFDPPTESFEVYPFPGNGAGVRQLLGRPGEVWGGASALNQVYVLYTMP
jgi:virginiamycin B lyase